MYASSMPYRLTHSFGREKGLARGHIVSRGGQERACAWAHCLRGAGNGGLARGHIFSEGRASERLREVLVIIQPFIDEMVSGKTIFCV